MNLLVGFLLVAGVTVVTVTAMLLVRRRSPEGSWFSDGDRASGVFGVLATGFSVLLGFIVFLAFTSYDQSRSGAEAEALAVQQQVETAQFLPQPAGARLTGELICYARYVEQVEWSEMESGTSGDRPNPWAVRMFTTLKGVEPTTASQGSAYDKWLDETADREEARRDRVHGAEGVIPTPLWVVLFVISAIVFVYMIFFADRGERAVTQALLMGSVTIVITTMLLLLAFLDDPFNGGVGSLEPVAIQRTQRLIDSALGSVQLHVMPPCDASGRPV
ncbi:MAG TPA: hypothetical protein VL422_17240 [Miltoncostaea sp.]|nr:hypothetical protein [Miltoncostaea sp.]